MWILVGLIISLFFYIRHIRSVFLSEPRDGIFKLELYTQISMGEISKLIFSFFIVLTYAGFDFLYLQTNDTYHLLQLDATLGSSYRNVYILEIIQPILYIPRALLLGDIKVAFYFFIIGICPIMSFWGFQKMLYGQFKTKKY